MELDFFKEAKIYVNTDIEPLTIGFFEVNISSNEGFLQTKHILIGQTLSGEILSEERCKEILNLPVEKIEEDKNTLPD